MKSNKSEIAFIAFSIFILCANAWYSTYGSKCGKAIEAKEKELYESAITHNLDLISVINSDADYVTYLQENTPEIVDNEIEALADTYYGSLGVTAEELDIICRVAQVEVRGASDEAIAHLVNVIRNRVNSSEFPNDYYAVCTQSGQFEYGYSYSNSMQESVLRALEQPDNTDGALFFCTCYDCGRANSRVLIMQDEVGHYFWK